MIRRRKKHSQRMLMRRTFAVLLLLLLGTLCGMAFRTWLVPHLPATIVGMLGESKATGGQAASQEGREIAFWKSSMIPNFVSPKPGVDPMNMDLMPVYMDELSDESLITLSHEVTHNMGLRTVSVEFGAASRVVRTVGEVDYAEPLLGDVTLKVGGWVEELYVDFVGQRVTKGQPLFAVYSPEVYSAVEEYLISLQDTLPQRRPGGISLRTNDLFPAYDKLRFWDVPESEIERSRQPGRRSKTITFESPFDGWVIEKHAFRGMYMEPGSRYYRIADLSTMWVYVTIFE